MRPFLGDSQSRYEPEPEVKDPKDGFQPSDPEESAETRPDLPPTEDFRKGGGRSAAQAALRAFPQVVHLLVDPRGDFGENLSKEVGLPLVSLVDGAVEKLATELAKPEYDNGFILEGYPTDAASAEKLDTLLQNVDRDDRRVLGWELTDQKHQSVLDHYMDKDLLWMVPESLDPSDTQEAKAQILSCLVGLPVLK